MKYFTKKGYVVWHLEGEAYIIDELVANEKNKGYGTKMLKHVEKYVADRRINKIEFFASPLDKETSKDRLLEFYRERGYEDNECEGFFSKEIYCKE